MNKHPYLRYRVYCRNGIWFGRKLKNVSGKWVDGPLVAVINHNLGQAIDDCYANSRQREDRRLKHLRDKPLRPQDERGWRPR